MQDLFLPFLILPGIAATLAGWLVQDWRLGAALLAGGLAILVLPPGTLGGLRPFLAPVASGLAVAGAVLTALLLWRVEVAVWTRMTACLVAAFLTHLALMSAMFTG